MYLQYTGLYCSKHVLYRYLKSTVNNIQLISKFRVTSEEEVVSREKRLFGFWMEFFIEAIKQESSGTQFPVCVPIHMSACVVCLYVCLSTLFVCVSVHVHVWLLRMSVARLHLMATSDSPSVHHFISDKFEACTCPSERVFFLSLNHDHVLCFCCTVYMYNIQC